MNKNDVKLNVVSVPLSDLKPCEYNARSWSKEAIKQLEDSIKIFGLVDPILANSSLDRNNVVIGGNFRLSILKKLGYEEVPVIYLDIPDLKQEKELNLRLNKNQGEFDYGLLTEFDETLLFDVGFSSEELDNIFNEDEEVSDMFDLSKELEKLSIKEITVKKGDVYDLDGSRLMCGDSLVEADWQKLMGDHKIDMVLTDPPYRLDYLKGKTRNGKPTEGFGAKKNRKYLETDILPEDFTALWMGNIAKFQQPNFSIIVYENWKNMREIWNEMEKYWKVKNMIIWHTKNRNQGYAAKNKFFSKYDIALAGASTNSDVAFNLETETDGLQEEYESALFAISGKPHWESYGKGNKYCPTDFIEFNTADEKSSGQGIIFGVKPLEILIPYIKILSKRGDLIVEPFGGSGSTLIASIKMKRRCFLMEKVPTYAEVILNRWERITGKKRIKIHDISQD